MICPRCSTRNELGISHCRHCGTPFTRGAARRTPREPGNDRDTFRYQDPQQAPPKRADYRVPPARKRPRREPRSYRRGVGPGSRAIGGLIAFLIVTIVIIAAASLLGAGDNASRLTEGISDQARGLVGYHTDDDEPAVAIPPAPAEPQGEQTWVLTEQELNQRVANRQDAFGPANDVRVELQDGTVLIRFRAYGVNGTYHGSLTTRDGVPVVADSRIDGPIGWVASSSDIDQMLNEEMASVVHEQQVSVESVHVRPGEVVFGISG